MYDWDYKKVNNSLINLVLFHYNNNITPVLAQNSLYSVYTMTHITTRQRDLIQILTNSNSNLGIKSLADQLNLSPRQVQYDLVQIRTWLKIRGVSLMMKPGVGVCLESTSLQKQIIMEELKHSTHIQLILTPKQRQQLIIFLFLTSDEAIILNHLQYVLQVSRTTILKDLESVELWFQEKDIHFLRRTNFGFQIDCSEKQRREGLTQALWGNNEDTETPFMRMSHINGLQFEFKEDYERLEILAQTNQIFKTLNTRQVMRRVTYAEAQLGGRFTDDAVLYLSLVYAVQAYRANQKKYIKIPEEAIQWVKERLAWPVAQHIAKNLALNPYHIWPDSEVAFIAMHLMSAPRNERWPGDVDAGFKINQVLDEVVDMISEIYHLPNMRNDRVLRDGIAIQTIPALFRKRFDLWYAFQPQTDSEKNIQNLDLDTAQKIIERIASQIDIPAPLEETENIALLLRASLIRERSLDIGKVIVVCPSGMATAQLLVARLKVHFPRFDKLEVVPLRDVIQNQHLNANLIITTIPISLPQQPHTTILQVHPLLLPENIEEITRFLNIFPSGEL